jgi:hypothetical protein
MAKRKRLTPAQPGHFATGFPPEGRAPETKSMPLPGSLPGSLPASPAPIAQVSGDSSARAALADAVEAARSEGLMIEVLPLAAIDPRHLVRDRIDQDEDEMAALRDSLRARGQQTPIEVIRLPAPVDGMTHGLISGSRRLNALHRLYAETNDDRFATVRARVIAPDTAQDAYVAMVEENEIRVDLTLYERARIAVKAVQEGVYPTSRTALQGLFAATTRSKRSKIGSFMPLVEALDPVLNFPTAITEKLGLALAREITADDAFAGALLARLRDDPRPSAADELRLLTAALSGQRKASAAPRKPTPTPEPAAGAAPAQGNMTELRPGLSLRHGRRDQVIEIRGDQVTEALYAALKDWLKAR